MKKEKGSFLFLINAGMEISWTYAWATYLTLAFLHRLFPLPDALATFALAAVLTHFSRGKGWRVIEVVGIQILGFVLAGLRIIYVFEYPSHSFLSSSWVIEFLKSPRGTLAWMALLYLVFWTLFFWIRGMNFVRKPMTYDTTCSRFDLGLAAFFALFLTKLVVFVKGGGKIDESLTQYLAFAFFAFGLLAIGLARNQTGERKDFLPRFQGIGMILSFAVLIIMFGAGLVLLFWPYLGMAAEVTYAGIKTAAGPLGSILVAVLRFLYLGGAKGPAESDPGGQGGPEDLSFSHTHSWWSEVLEKVLTWGLFGLLGLALMVMVAIGIFYLVRWLFSKTAHEERRPGRRFIPDWIIRIRTFFARLSGKIIGFLRGCKSGMQLFGALLVWGRRSGLHHSLSETPLEYGTRLKSRFPALKGQIDLIIESFSQEVYGEIVLDRQQIDGGRCALRNLRSPRHWPLRMKSWLLRPGESPSESDV